MITITSRIKSKTERPGKDGKKPYTRVELESGHKFNLFKAEDIAFLQVGETYTVTLEEDGQYWNFVSAIPASEEEAQSAERAPNGERDSIQRAVALKAAVEYAGEDKSIDSDHVLRIAQKFLAFLEGRLPDTQSSDTDAKQEPNLGGSGGGGGQTVGQPEKKGPTGLSERMSGELMATSEQMARVTTLARESGSPMAWFTEHAPECIDGKAIKMNKLTAAKAVALLKRTTA